MTRRGSDEGEMQLNGVSEEMKLLLLDFETEVMEGSAGRGDATCSVSLCPAFRNDYPSIKKKYSSVTPITSNKCLIT